MTVNLMVLWGLELVGRTEWIAWIVEMLQWRFTTFVPTSLTSTPSTPSNSTTTVPSASSCTHPSPRLLVFGIINEKVGLVIEHLRVPSPATTSTIAVRRLRAIRRLGISELRIEVEKRRVLRLLHFVYYPTTAQ